MRTFLVVAVAVFTLIAVTVASPSFAKEKSAAKVAGKPAKFVRFVSKIEKSWRGDVDMDASETMALNQAQAWIDANHAHVRIISHSVTGNYHGYTQAIGFSSVIILYEDK